MNSLPLNQIQQEFDHCMEQLWKHKDDEKKQVLDKRRIVELLAFKNLDPSSRQNLALRTLSYIGNKELVEILLQNPKLNMNANFNDSLCLACSTGRLDVVDLLLKDGRLDPTIPSSIFPDDLGNNALETACAYGHLSVVQLLLNDPRVDPSSNDCLAVTLAAGNGHSNILERLLQDQRVVSNCRPHEALIEAILEDHEECIRILLTNEGINSYECKSNAIQLAIERKYYSVIKYLLPEEE
jgi:ankyrin repeat protein